MESQGFSTTHERRSSRGGIDGVLGGRRAKRRDDDFYLDRSYSILIVSASAAFANSLVMILPKPKYRPTTVTTAADAKRKFLERSYDVIVVNAPLPDEFGVEFAFDVCDEHGACAMIFVYQDVFAEVNAKATPRGVCVLSKPTAGQVVLQHLSFLCGVRERLRMLEKKTATVEEKMKEIRIINHAKLLLVEQLKMTEGEAHRYIEKQAMDRCVTKKEIAETIIAMRRD